MEFKDYACGDTVVRQGEVLLKKTENKILGDKDVVVVSDTTLQSGSSFDHNLSGKFYIRREGDRRFLGLLDDCTLNHTDPTDGHKPISLTPSMFDGTELEVSVKTEYDHFAEESRNVAD